MVKFFELHWTGQYKKCVHCTVRFQMYSSDYSGMPHKKSLWEGSGGKGMGVEWRGRARVGRGGVVKLSKNPGRAR